MSNAIEAVEAAAPVKRTPLNRQQIIGFWAAWAGWLLDGTDSVIYALVLGPALTELLPHSNIEATPANVGFAGSTLFALFLVGWGMSFIWGPIADRFGRTRTLAATIFIYALFTGAAALSQNVYQLALFRFLAGVGIGGEWAMAGTYVAESWPEDRRKAGAGYLQTGYYFGFFVAAMLNATVGAQYGWRAMFLCGMTPVIVAIATLIKVREPEKWERLQDDKKAQNSLREIFAPAYLRRTLVMSALLTVAIIGLWAGSVYVPTAVTTLAKNNGYAQADAVRIASYAMGLLSLSTVIGCLFVPMIAEKFGRRFALGLYFAGMFISIIVAFGWAYYLPADRALTSFFVALFFLGFSGANFAMFSIWLPELFGTKVRATAFAFCTSFGRFIGAGVNFALGAAIHSMGTLGTPIALTSIAFAIGLLIIPLAVETKGKVLPS